MLGLFRIEHYEETCAVLSSKTPSTVIEVVHPHETFKTLGLLLVVFFPGATRILVQHRIGHYVQDMSQAYTDAMRL